MPNYNSSRISNALPARARNGFEVVFSGTVTVGVALILSDTVTLAKLPVGAMIVDVKIKSNGTQSGSDSVFTVGDSTDTARYITTAAGLALRSGGGYSSLNAVGATKGAGYVITSTTDTVILTITTAGTGQTTGGLIDCFITYTMQQV